MHLAKADVAARARGSLTSNIECMQLECYFVKRFNTVFIIWFYLSLLFVYETQSKEKKILISRLTDVKFRKLAANFILVAIFFKTIYKLCYIPTDILKVSHRAWKLISNYTYMCIIFVKRHIFVGFKRDQKKELYGRHPSPNLAR